MSRWFALAAAALLAMTAALSAAPPLGWAVPLAADTSRARIDRTLDRVERQFEPAHIPALLEVSRFAKSPHTKRGVFATLQRATGERHGADLNAWWQWWWNQPAAATSDYADFKADLYGHIDPRFAVYFRGRQDTARIRLDEVRWGGVRQDGIPPLRRPKRIPAADADYLDDDDVVFGLEVDGDARAYPKRILAWHEMFVDEVGGVEIAGVYCTLCGTVIPYETTLDGTRHELGTSGFLYRSNKLMYDRATQSLWNTLRGEPVLGPLVDRGIRLKRRPVVTTTWGAWRALHPDTTVLSLETGHRRDYSEGAAYRDYFATDALMFNTPFDDDRLANKQPVLALRFAGSPYDQVAISAEFLAAHPLYTDTVGSQRVLVLTDTTGAHRVYDPGDVTFVRYDGATTVVDDAGETWSVSESALRSGDRTRLRLPAHDAFWFGWHATFPETRLVR
jgi:hypothetical protein